MNNIQRDFEAYLGFPYNFSKYDDGSYVDVYVQHLWTGWRMAHHKYCQSEEVV